MPFFSSITVEHLASLNSSIANIFHFHVSYFSHMPEGMFHFLTKMPILACIKIQRGDGIKSETSFTSSRSDCQHPTFDSKSREKV